GLVVSLGFGGADAAVCIARPGNAHVGSATRVMPGRDEPIAITGLGILVPGQDDELHVSEETLAAIEPARAVRRLARLARLVRAAGILAVRDAGLDHALLASTAGFVASRFGAVAYTLDCYEEIVRDGLDAGNPLFFAESVPNIGSAQLSLGLGLEAATLSVIGTRIAGLEAMHLASRHLRSGQATRALVVAAEESEPRLRQILHGVGVINTDDGGTRLPEGAVGILVELGSAAEARQARIHGWVGQTTIEWPKATTPLSAARALRTSAARVASSGDTPHLCPSPAPIGHFERRILDQQGVGGVVERHAVGPLLRVAEDLAGGDREGAWCVVAADESGGAGGISIVTQVPSSP
ncbi:MAG: hypothetical protein MK085_05375, partial [Phycisphaerales bacterium]|nr:hypothetical protein [Phycisphaerales bacterium]